MATKKGSDSAPNWDPMGMGGEFRTGPVVGTALITGKTFDFKALPYAEVDGLAIFEGDIVLGPVAVIKAGAVADAAGGQLPQYACGITGANVRWPNGLVPYEIDPALPNQQRISDAIAHWEANTRIRFVLRTAANQAQYLDYLRFIPSSGCWSYVGRRGGMQELGLAAGCGTGNTIHEIGHTVGLWHEQSREDRDTFVRIEWANIDPAAQHNFTQHIADGEDLGVYDYGSIMHYPPTAFSINGQQTIVALQPLPAGVVMGQRNGLSQGDIDGVHAMYPPPTIKEVSKDPIKDPRKEPIKDPIKDPIRDTIKEVRKDPIHDTIKEVRKDPIHDTIKEVRKDPIVDTGTVKEIASDPINPGIPTQPWDYSSGASPFVTGAPSRVQGGVADPIAEALARVQELEGALLAIEQQTEQLLVAYEEAVAILQSLGGG
jgi:hypothetical protein